MVKLVLVLTLPAIFSCLIPTTAGLPRAAEVDTRLKAHFNGLNFSVGVITDPPFVIKDSSRGENAAWSGISVEQIKKLATAYGFTIAKFVELNMTYDEAVERVGKGESGVDIACQLFTSTAPRERVASLTKSPVDFSYVTLIKSSLLEEAFTLTEVKAFDTNHTIHIYMLYTRLISYARLAYASRTEKNFKRKFGSLCEPFSLDLWILVVLSLPVMSLILTLFESDSKKDLHHGSWFMRFLKSLYSNTALMFGQLTIMPRRPESLLVILAWMLFTFSLVAFYTANLASFLTYRSSSILSTEDVITGRSHVLPCRLSVHGETAVQTYVKRYIGTKKPGISFIKCSSPEECIQKVEEDEASATIYDRPFLQYLINEKYCGKIEVSSEPFFPQSSSWVLPKNSPHTKAFSDAIMAHRDDGSFEKILKSFIDIEKCSKSLSEERDPIGIGTGLGGLFTVIATLILVAFCTHFWRRYKNRRLLDEDRREVDVNSLAPID